MAYSYLFDPLAADEYEEAFRWYEKKSYLAADNFIIRFQEAITSICADPYRYRNGYKNLRELPLKKYPYHVIYYIDDVRSIVVIVSIFHAKRNPKKKYRKK
jgi:plasmid stabilization system protein ParE